ncbi:hypothetical protein OSTOST_11279 [Ostertagia ostertagi]
MRERRLQWYGHVIRAAPDTVAATAYRFEVDGKRPRGRPRQRWQDSINKENKAVLAALTAYSVFFTDIPLGHDTTHISHAFDLTLAYQRIFFGLALTLRSEMFRRLMKRKTRVSRMMDRQNASNYFDGLKTMWS